MIDNNFLSFVFIHCLDTLSEFFLTPTLKTLNLCWSYFYLIHHFEHSKHHGLFNFESVGMVVFLGYWTTYKFYWESKSFEGTRPSSVFQDVGGSARIMGYGWRFWRLHRSFLFSFIWWFLRFDPWYFKLFISSRRVSNLRHGLVLYKGKDLYGIWLLLTNNKTNCL